MRAYISRFMSAVMAGICISIGCIVFLRVGGIAGAVLFTFGLLAVVHYGYALYTGTAGFISSWRDFADLLMIVFIGNFIGCALTALAALASYDDIRELAQKVVEQRTTVSYLGVTFRAVFCGFLMTTAVKFGREGRWLPLLFAVPLFILAGFYHSIADAFYLLAAGIFTTQTICNYVLMVVGNFLGCNLYRIVISKDSKKEA
ncbi:MAG TPA: hypothetical protein DEO38_05050 [Bacteroidales bacterium]|nr:hypothetical protein [Bacteroidales bacterium]